MQRDESSVRKVRNVLYKKIIMGNLNHYCSYVVRFITERNWLGLPLTKTFKIDNAVVIDLFRLFGIWDVKSFVLYVLETSFLTRNLIW